MTGRSERDFVRFGNRHRLQQLLHFLQVADFPNEDKEFIEAGEAANGLDRLGQPICRAHTQRGGHVSAAKLQCLGTTDRVLPCAP